jgi:hypothetical protein
MRCPVCSGPMRTTALTAVEEAAQVFPRVSAAWRCAAWPACDTRRVEHAKAVGGRTFTVGTFVVTLDRSTGTIVDVDGPDSDVVVEAWGPER